MVVCVQHEKIFTRRGLRCMSWTAVMFGSLALSIYSSSRPRFSALFRSKSRAPRCAKCGAPESLLTIPDSAKRVRKSSSGAGTITRIINFLSSIRQRPRSPNAVMQGNSCSSILCSGVAGQERDQFRAVYCRTHVRAEMVMSSKGKLFLTVVA